MEPAEDGEQFVPTSNTDYPDEEGAAAARTGYPAVPIRTPETAVRPPASTTGGGDENSACSPPSCCGGPAAGGDECRAAARTATTGRGAEPGGGPTASVPAATAPVQPVSTVDGRPLWASGPRPAGYDRAALTHRLGARFSNEPDDLWAELRRHHKPVEDASGFAVR